MTALAGTLARLFAWDSARGCKRAGEYECVRTLCGVCQCLETVLG